MRTLALLSLLTLATPAWGQNLEGELKDLTWVGFQQFQDASRVFVRTNEKVKFRVDTSRDKIIELILENTRVAIPNNTRFLDTRFFDSPVTFIQPRVIEGPSPSVRIEIHLASKVPYNTTQTDNVVALDFTR